MTTHRWPDMRHFVYVWQAWIQGSVFQHQDQDSKAQDQDQDQDQDAELQDWLLTTQVEI